MKIPLNLCDKCSLCMGTLLIALGIGSMAYLPNLIEYFINKELPLKPGYTSFKEWQKTRPLIMDIYMFNWTNPEDIYNSSIKPKFEEVGPYRFIQVREKMNITWNSNNQTITYQNKLYYYYHEKSPRNYSDVVTTINMVAWAVAQETKDSNMFLKQGAKFALMFSKLSVTKTVRELLFEGYEDPLISMASSFSFLSSSSIPDRVGFFYGRNESVGLDGIFNVHIHLDDEYGIIKYWNYDNKLPFYKGTCAELYGSAGEFYPRFAKPDHITFFSSDMCRILTFKYEKNHTVYGISTYKYSAGKEIFDNGTVIKENACYCNTRCFPSGVIDMSACSTGLPVFLSLPHFYNGDTSYVNAVEGLRPEKDKHEFYFALEPNLGIISDTAARVQMNVLLEPIQGFTLYEKAPKIMFPIFWTDNLVSLYEDYAWNVRLLLKSSEINKTASTCVIVLGIFCIGCVIFFKIFCAQEKLDKIKLAKEEVPLTFESEHINKF